MIGAKTIVLYFCIIFIILKVSCSHFHVNDENEDVIYENEDDEYDFTIEESTNDTFQFSSDTRIIGGTPANSGEFKAAVSLQTFGRNHYCGGSLINLNFILTAAHCIIANGQLLFNPEQISIVGDTLLFSSQTDSTQTRKVKTVLAHPEYNEEFLVHDIGIMQVTEPFLLTATLNPIALSMSTPKDDTPCSVAGWGTESFINPQASFSLLKIDIIIINKGTCNSRNSYNGLAPENSVCAGDLAGGKDSCQGDSGGGLICGHILCGVVSFGKECALPNFPGVYTDVSKYIEWIHRIANDIIEGTTQDTANETTEANTVGGGDGDDKTNSDTDDGGISLRYSITLLTFILIINYIL